MKGDFVSPLFPLNYEGQIYRFYVIKFEGVSYVNFFFFFKTKIVAMTFSDRQNFHQSSEKDSYFLDNLSYFNPMFKEIKVIANKLNCICHCKKDLKMTLFLYFL